MANLLNTGLNLFTNASVDSLVNGTIDTGLNLTFNSLFNRTFDKNGTEGAVVETVINLVKVTVIKCGDVLFTKTILGSPLLCHRWEFRMERYELLQSQTDVLKRIMYLL